MPQSLTHISAWSPAPCIAFVNAATKSAYACTQATSDVAGSKSSMKPETLIFFAKAATSATCLSALPEVTLALVRLSAGVTLRPRAQYGANCWRR